MDGKEQNLTPKDPSELHVPRRRRTLLPSRKGQVVERVRTGVDHPFLILVIILLAIGTTFVVEIQSRFTHRDGLSRRLVHEHE